MDHTHRACVGPRPVELTRLGYGGAPIGNLGASVTDDDAQAALQAAWDAGIRYFDTAPWYGVGLSEHRVGQFLRDKPQVGVRPVDQGRSAAQAMACTLRPEACGTIRGSMRSSSTCVSTTATTASSEPTRTACSAWGSRKSTCC